MSDAIAPQRYSKPVSAVRLMSVSFVGQLESGELLSGTPTVVDNSGSPAELTLSNKAINTAELTLNGRTVAIGQAVQFRVSGGLAGSEYTIMATASSDSSPAQNLIGGMILNVIADPV